MRSWVEKIIETGEEQGYWEEKTISQDEEKYRPGDSEVKDLKADYSKLNDLTGWKPETGWDEGLKKTVKWYANNLDRY